MVAGLDSPVVWEGSIPLRYEYTAGVAGERFLRALKTSGVLVSRCGKCLRRYLPPRAFCVHCFQEITDYRPAPRSGYVYSYAVLPVGKGLGEKKLKISGGPRRRTVGLIRFKGVEGGLIHLLDGGRRIRIGLKVVPVFKPPHERRGALTDIVGFVPV